MFLAAVSPLLLPVHWILPLLASVVAAKKQTKSFHLICNTLPINIFFHYPQIVDHLKLCKTLNYFQNQIFLNAIQKLSKNYFQHFLNP